MSEHHANRVPRPQHPVAWLAVLGLAGALLLAHHVGALPVCPLESCWPFILIK